MKAKSIILGALLGIAAFGSIAAQTPQAAPTVVTNPSTCTLSSWTITGVKLSAVPGPIPSLPQPLSATSCLGVIGGNDSAGGTLSPSPNLGYLGDGLLNGQTINSNPDTYVSPTQFIDPSQLLALETTAKVDPGWIMLGSGTPGNIAYTTEPIAKLSDLLTLNINTNGTWEILINKDIKSLLEAAGIFNRSYFDHLAFTVKAGNDQSGGGWAIYDFDFNKIPGFDLTQVYSFSGLWNTADFGGKQISHMSIWARDPITTNDVPLPGTLALLGAGFLALGLVKRRAGI